MGGMHYESSTSLSTDTLRGGGHLHDGTRGTLWEGGLHGGTRGDTRGGGLHSGTMGGGPA